MTLANLVTLSLVVLGIGGILFAALIGGLPLLTGQEATLEMLRWMDRVTGTEPSPLLQPMRQDPMGFLLLTVAATTLPMATGLALSSVGFVLWRRIGRRDYLLQTESADCEPDREQVLQSLIRESLDCAMADGSERPSGPGPGLEWGLGRLDTSRRHRLDLFLRESGLDPLPLDLQPAPQIRLPTPTAQRQLLARILLILLMAGSAFFFLWGILSAFSVQLMPELVGFPTPPHVSAAALFTSWIGTLTLLTAAVGVHRLSRWDRRVRERWEKGVEAAAERILAGYCDCLTRLHPSLSGSEVRVRLARGLTLCAIQGLDRAGRKRLIEVGLDRGALPPGSDLLDR